MPWTKLDWVLVGLLAVVLISLGMCLMAFIML